MNCLTDKFQTWSKFPALLTNQDSILSIPPPATEVCRFVSIGGGRIQFFADASCPCWIDGASQFEEHIPFEQDHSLFFHNQLFLFRITHNPAAWVKGLEPKTWCISDSDGTPLEGPSSLQSLLQKAGSLIHSNPSSIIHHSASSTGFYIHLLEPLLPKVPTAQRPVSASAVAIAHEPALQSRINSDSGEFTCPACWLQFDRGDVMHIASHQKLKGDQVLGEDAMMRFLATNFNNLGQALDAMGIPTSDLACPHCRSKLPSGFMDLKQHILSIVGAPQSGKSYFLSVLTHVAKGVLFTKFDTTFHDGDPTGNRLLTTVTNNLFSASTPEQARIAKTGLEGDMYLEIPRRGRKVKMPRPFTFQLTPSRSEANPVALVFYDNAGEHFEPGIDAHGSPGAQHISAASGIVYLFDPTYNTSFRRKLRDSSSDPQLSAEGFDQQDTILAEMNVRVKNLQGLNHREKISTPLAIVVGKCDVWSHLLGEWKFENPVEMGRVNHSKIRQNSDIVRRLLLDFAPAIVANAEIISNNVTYFPSSSFGCSPSPILDASGKPKLENGRPILGPDPSKLSPILVEVPLLWILSQCEPTIVPPHQN